MRHKPRKCLLLTKNIEFHAIKTQTLKNEPKINHFKSVIKEPLCPVHFFGSTAHENKNKWIFGWFSNKFSFKKSVLNGTGKCSVLLDELDEHFISKVLKNQKFSKIKIELIKVVTFCFIWMRVTLTDYDVSRKLKWKAFKANIRCLVFTVEIVLAADAEKRLVEIAAKWGQHKFNMGSILIQTSQSHIRDPVSLELHNWSFSTPKNTNFCNYCMFSVKYCVLVTEDVTL